jgi:hypothetical protein
MADERRSNAAEPSTPPAQQAGFTPPGARPAHPRAEHPISRPPPRAPGGQAPRTAIRLALSRRRSRTRSQHRRPRPDHFGCLADQTIRRPSPSRVAPGSARGSHRSGRADFRHPALRPRVRYVR